MPTCSLSAAPPGTHPSAFGLYDAFLCTLHRNGSREYVVFRVCVFEVHPCRGMMARPFLLSSALLYGDGLSILLQVGGRSNCFHLGLLRIRMLLCLLSALTFLFFWCSSYTSDFYFFIFKVLLFLKKFI